MSSRSKKALGAPAATLGPYVPPPPHAVPAEAAAYVAAMDDRTRALHEMAIELLGSSYFVEWSHGFKAFQTATRTTSKGTPP